MENESLKLCHRRNKLIRLDHRSSGTGDFVQLVRRYIMIKFPPHMILGVRPITL